MESANVISWASVRRFLPAAGWAGATAAAGALFIALAHAPAPRGVPPGARGLAASCAVALALSLVVPGVFVSLCATARTETPDDLRRRSRAAGSALAGAAAGALAFALASDPAAALPAVESLVVIAAAAVSFGALARALGKALRSGVAGGCAAGGALLVLLGVPFWSRPVFLSSAGAAWGRWLMGASPFLASAMPWTGGSAAWSFDPRTGVLYGIWVGTDVPVFYPSWIACAVGHLAAAALLVAAAELPGVLRRRGGHGAATAGTSAAGA